jgi:hypothetical protein
MIIPPVVSIQNRDFLMWACVLLLDDNTQVVRKDTECEEVDRIQLVQDKVT